MCAAVPFVNIFVMRQCESMIERSFGTAPRMLESAAPSISHEATASHSAILCPRRKSFFFLGSVRLVAPVYRGDHAPKPILRMGVVESGTARFRRGERSEYEYLGIFVEHRVNVVKFFHIRIISRDIDAISAAPHMVMASSSPRRRRAMYIFTPSSPPP